MEKKKKKYILAYNNLLVAQDLRENTSHMKTYPQLEKPIYNRLTSD